MVVPPVDLGSRADFFAFIICGRQKFRSNAQKRGIR